MSQIALGWLLHKEWVDAPIVGTSVEHLEPAAETSIVVLMIEQPRGIDARMG